MHRVVDQELAPTTRLALASTAVDDSHSIGQYIVLQAMICHCSYESSSELSDLLVNECRYDGWLLKRSAYRHLVRRGDGHHTPADYRRQYMIAVQIHTKRLSRSFALRFPVPLFKKRK